MARKPAAPRCAYWREGVLWGRIKVAGTEIRWSLRTSDPRVAERRIKERRESERALTFFGEQRHTWGQAVKAWALEAVGQISPSTAARYATSLDQCEPFLGNLFLDQIDRAVLADMAKARKRDGRTVATIRRDLTAVSRVLDYAEAHGWRPDNPALAVMKRFHERRDPIVLPRQSDIDMLADAAPGSFAAMIRFAALTGMRQAEISSLTHRQIDHARRQVAIYKTKTSRPRFLSLTPEAFGILRQIPRALGSDVVFWHSEGEPYRSPASNHRRCVAVAQKRAQRQKQDFRPFRFHDLRHFYAVQFLKDGGSIYDLQQNLGHSTIGTTELYLQFLTPEEARVSKEGAAQKAAHDHRFVIREAG